MLYTNYCGCCTLFQTTTKNYRARHLKSTDLNRIQVTTCPCLVILNLTVLMQVVLSATLSRLSPLQLGFEQFQYISLIPLVR